MKGFLVGCINFYQKFLSPDQGLPRKLGLTRGGNCVFLPTCSEYTKEAIIKYGPIKGIALGARRISRCHPWQKNHYDPLK